MHNYYYENQVYNSELQKKHRIMQNFKIYTTKFLLQ